MTFMTAAAGIPGLRRGDGDRTAEVATESA